MASGTAYRWSHPARDVLNLYRDPWDSKAPRKLYKAPRNRVKARKLLSTPLVSQLPVEILHQILFELDLLSLGMLRRVNTITRRLVESFPAYHLLRKHASDTLRVMDATKCTSHFPIRWLDEEFCHPWCRKCGDFGPFIYLPTISRSCFQCSLSHREYRVAAVPNLVFHFGLSETHIKSLPIIYALRAGKKRRRRFVDVTQAKDLGKRVHGGLENMRESFQERLKAYDKKYELELEKYQKRAGDRAGRPRLCQPSYLRRVSKYMSKYWRLKATTSFPYWNRQTSTLEPGAYCRACTYRWEEEEEEEEDGSVLDSQPQIKKDYDRAFLEADLPQHFLHCPAVKENYNFQKKKRWCDHHKRAGTDFIVSANSSGRKG
ncbi:hypothetical protein ASPWEDRAFT_593396 [Aspergillus wentii DTO 134E9]|uniref:F-box domain-containing protein n=1 Tax=Aspergillus wentii DTO 134E9 TaxID=1073089 RepID=A0A1L9RD59_ASPWE|nr:uncharacterized protein ASPWEDRAFT_593396 [Aspergillus wentii DTO 134E9]OJJ32797.1 hypothetical protein ASPWEDRAFT_593396 [Aspergillus wentii DTO 134E9]